VLQIAEEYNEYQRQSMCFLLACIAPSRHSILTVHPESLAKNLGGIPNPSYRPHDLLSNPPRPSEVTLELLLAAQSHMGHATSRWNPANSAYIFGVRDGTHIISLDVTAAHLRRAAKVVSAVAAKGGLILFVGTREGQERIVVRAAELAGAYHLFERWVPGSLTNSSQILGRCKLKVVNEFDEEVADANVARQVEALPPMKPDLVVCVNPLENRALLLECAQNGIPTVGVVDTDADPTWVTYPVPANDDRYVTSCLRCSMRGSSGLVLTMW
jgi:small subunit ribosomal protein S2